VSFLCRICCCAYYLNRERRFHSGSYAQRTHVRLQQQNCTLHIQTYIISIKARLNQTIIFTYSQKILTRSNRQVYLEWSKRSCPNLRSSTPSQPSFFVSGRKHSIRFTRIVTNIHNDKLGRKYISSSAEQYPHSLPLGSQRIFLQESTATCPSFARKDIPCGLIL
jgi:hypothetical protein